MVEGILLRGVQYFGAPTYARREQGLIIKSSQPPKYYFPTHPCEPARVGCSFQISSGLRTNVPRSPHTIGEHQKVLVDRSHPSNQPSDENNPNQSTMKALAQLIVALLLTAIPALASEPSDKAIRHLKGGSKKGGGRDLKGSKYSSSSWGKGKGKGGGWSSSKGSKGGCETMKVYYLVRDLKEHSEEIGGGSGSGNQNATVGYTIDELPIFYLGGKKAGFLTEANIVTGDDCSYTGVFSFDPNEKDRSMDQIFYQGTVWDNVGTRLQVLHQGLCLTQSLLSFHLVTGSCSSAKANAITGGTGSFICASGAAMVHKKSKSRVILEIEACNSC